MRKTPVQRFAEKVLAPRDPDLCWQWRGYINSLSGYGYFYYEKRNVPAHRVSYMMFVGDIPEGMVLDHLCENRGCVNPRHLEPVTHGENLHRSHRTLTNYNRSKTHCPSGHEYAGDNLGLTKHGYRKCRKCHADREREMRKLFHKIGPLPRTHCPRGHEYTPENSMLQRNGTKVCKTCHREKERVRRATLRAQLAGPR